MKTIFKYLKEIELKYIILAKDLYLSTFLAVFGTLFVAAGTKDIKVGWMFGLYVFSVSEICFSIKNLIEEICWVRRHKIENN